MVKWFHNDLISGFVNWVNKKEPGRIDQALVMRFLNAVGL